MVDGSSQSQQRADSDAPTAAIILAAGKSTRMKSDQPKVLHNLCGRPMLAYVLDACRDAGITEFHVVVGFGKDDVIGAFSSYPGTTFVEQRQQNGTGHAVSMCADAFKGFSGNVIVIAGDMPLIRAQTLRELIDNHRAAGAKASIATTVLDDPTSYGRIIRTPDGEFERIVEHRDCTPEQLRVCEVNPSYYCFDAQALFEALPKVKADNAKGEYYITDVLSLIQQAGHAVSARTSVPPEDAIGINSRCDLADVSKLMQRRIQVGWMDQGVTIVSPDNTWIDSRAQIGPGTVIRPFSYIDGNARVGSNCTVGPYAHIESGSVVEDAASVGPGALSALDATLGAARRHTNLPNARNANVARTPPAQAGCSTGGCHGSIE
jgi:bifunctional UDP-N-acetylglucosamine pyrophosphorylase/glucosamine-1-phosphate N-acetyltransferase